MARPDRILIADDDSNVQTLLTVSLEPLGYEIVAADNGAEAIEHLNTRTFDFAILDYMLPTFNGLQILRHVRERQIGTEVIMVTAYASLQTAVEALRLGAYDYITKPFQIDSIQSTVRRASQKKRLESRLSAIYDLSREMTASLSVSQVVAVVLDIAERVMALKACGLWLVDEGRDELYQVGALGSGQETDRRLSLKDGEGAIISAIQQGDLIYIPDLEETPDRKPMGTENRSELAIPLEVKGDVIGALNIESDEPDAFHQNDLRLLSTLAAQAAVAIENAQLFEKAQQEIVERKRAEKEAKQRNRELAALYEIGSAITSTLDLQRTLTLITKHTVSLLEVEACSLLLHDEQRDDLRFAAGFGAHSDSVLGKHMPADEGIAGWTFSHNEPLLVPDVCQDERWFSGFDQPEAFTTRSVLCVPLRSKGHTIGALEAMNKETGNFDQEDLQLLNSLAVPAATAIENARLFEEVRDSRAQLQALSHRLVEAQETERAYVARELHDETGQALSSLLLGLSLLEREADDPEAVVNRAVEMEELIDKMLENLHRLAMRLRPATLDHLGLVAALDQYVEDFDQQNSLDVQFETVGLNSSRLTSEIETTLYRIVQEALTNVVRHAEANRVDVLLEKRGDRVIAIVEDDGIGFDPETAMQRGRLGLFGMQERAEMLDGEVTFESTSEGGTTVHVEIPYAID